MPERPSDPPFHEFPPPTPDPKALRRLADLDAGSTDVAPDAPNSTPPPGRGPAGAVVASLVLPGAPSFFRRRGLSVALIFFGALVPVAAGLFAFLRRDRLASTFFDTKVLWTVQAAIALFVLARLVGVVEVIRARRPGTSKRLASWLAVVGVLLVGLPAGWGGYRAYKLGDVIDDVFLSSGSSDPLADSGRDPIGGAGEPESDELFNVLLVGGDEGPGRWALRTDTMILVSIHEPSGRIAMLSIPRNLRGVEFPADSPMGQEFPDGFPDLANAIYPYVYTHEEMAAQYQRGELSPEAVVLAQGLAYSLDVTIHDYVLVNMQGFLEIVDALGGVTMTLDERVPMPGNVPGAKHSYPDSVGPGVVEMDGTVALGFARSRSGDSDYGRMGRQRQLLEALASQTSGSDVLVKFPNLADVLKFTVRTSLSTDEFGMLVDRMRAGADIQESTGLGPPYINPGNPNFTDCANLLDQMQKAIISGVDFPYS